MTPFPAESITAAPIIGSLSSAEVITPLTFTRVWARTPVPVARVNIAIR